MRHDGQIIASLDMPYAGRKNVFQTQFTIPEVARDYEVLDITVTASQTEVANFGSDRKTYKLTP